MLTVHILASGSEGNCLLVSGGGIHLLVDAGISTKRIVTGLEQLGLSPRDVTGVLLTHEHSDHTAGLATLTKQYQLPLYASGGTANALCARIPGAADVVKVIPRQGTLSFGEMVVTVFPTSHDAAESVDYRFDCGGAAAGVLTDTGFVTMEAREALSGVGLLVLESNHDEEWLLSGPYPPYLKDRILGPKGHLSNDTAACFARMMAMRGTRRFVLAHLSKENNTPEKALQTAVFALEGLEAEVCVAPRAEVSGPYIAEVCVCSV